MSCLRLRWGRVFPGGFVLLVPSPAIPLLALACGLVPVGAANAGPSPETADEAVVETPHGPSTPAPAPSRGSWARFPTRLMVAEMRHVLEDERDAVAALSANLAQAEDPEAAARIQVEIERIKVETELTLLHIQARYARSEGRYEVAERIEAAIEAMTHPERETARGGEADIDGVPRR